MKQLLPIMLLLVLLSNVIDAQLDSFDLEDFVLPEVKLERLDFEGRFDGGAKKDRRNTSLTEKYYVNSDLNGTYWRFKNSRRLQQTISGQIYFQHESANQWMNLFPVEITNTNGLTVGLSFATMNRFYKPSKRFKGIGVKVFDNYISGYTSYNQTIKKNESFRNYISVPLEYGFGRVEPITSAWKALRILEELEKFDLLSHTPNRAEIIELAKTISLQNYRRFFDNRLSLIKRMKVIDSYLQDENIINDKGSTYFTLLYDTYLYGTQTGRYAGSRFTLKVEPFWHTNSSPALKAYGFKGGISYEKFKAIDQHWQLNYSANLRAIISKELDAKTSVIPFVEAGINGGYYPNSRTSFNASFSYSNYPLDPRPVQKSLNLSITADYYISPRTSILLFFSIDSNDYNEELVVSTISFKVQESNDFLRYGINFKHAFF